MRALWTLCGWGSAAALALLAVALTSLTDTGSERLWVATTPPPPPVEQAVATIDRPAHPTPKSDSLARQTLAEPEQTAVQTRPIRPEIPKELAAEMERAKKDRAEMEQLAATVRELAADRDRLRERVAGLEQELTDVTGSIARQSATAHAPPELPMKAALATAAAPPAVPVLKPPVGVPPLGSDVVFAPEIGSPMSESVPQPAPKTWPQPDQASGVMQPGAASAGAAAPADAMPPAGVPDEQGGAAADPQVLVEVPMPRARMAAISSQSEYAVDLGGVFSHEALAARWTELKGKFGSRLRGLRPLIKLETRFGYAPYRLVIGPLADEAAAKQLCTHLSGKVDCQPTRFAGNRLAQH